MVNASLSLSGMFRDLPAETVRRVVLAAADMALLLDQGGVVREVAFRSDALREELGAAGMWLDRPWRDTLTVESRPKLDTMLADARDGQPARWRQLNHPTGDGGDDVAISWSAIPAGTGAILLGRDQRQTAALQQRLVETQQFLERDYLALRRTEARYRILFETAQDGIAVLDAQSLRAVELNPAARRLLGQDARRMLSRPFAECFEDSRAGQPDDAAVQAAISMLLVAARAGQQPDPVSTVLNGHAVRLSVSGQREDDGWFLLARLSPEVALRDTVPPAPPPLLPDAMPELVSLMPDPAVLTDQTGDVVAANDAFRDLAGVAPQHALIGEPLSRWIGRDGVDLSVLISNLKLRGAVRGFNTEAHGEGGVRTAVEISASLRPILDKADETGDGFAFYLRDVGRRPGDHAAAGSQTAAATTRSADSMGGLIGRVPLKELVRNSTDAIERLCIEGALEMTGNNRAAAAEMLGLSRQSLYVKLRRFNMLGPDGIEPADGDPA